MEGDVKLLPVHCPVVWAEKRQSLCDALPYFKMHQGSLYSKQLIPKGFLIDGEFTYRDMMNTDIVITSLGGGRARTADGDMERVRECRRPALNSILKAWKEDIPIAVIVGRNYPLLPVQAPHAYNVLDWFNVTDLWVERESRNGVFIHKVRLERTNRIAKPWWQPSGSILSDLSYSADCAAVWAWCVECKQPSKTIFDGDIWTCLHKNCTRAFQFQPEMDTNKLVYSAVFINERTAFVPPHEALRPALPVLWENSCGTEIEFRCGIVCPKCFGCSRRRNWDRWVYETPGCPFVLIAPPPPYPLCRVEKENWEFNARKCLKQSRVGEHVVASRLTIGAYSAYQFLLADIKDALKVIGSVHVFRATAVTNARDEGPNSLWNEIQLASNQGFGLQRNPVRLAGHKSEVLTRHFQQNWGAPYKFVVNVLSKSFEEAPDAILKALMRLRWAGRESVRCTTQSLATDFVEFNELLSLGYMEGDRIGYHDDGEDTLGPTVATLSLGSPALMAFRIKKKHNSDQREVLRFPIYHGDMVVMHGTDIHQFYEAYPAGMRRFAMTSRNIVLDTLDEHTRLEAIRKGNLPERAHGWQYDGL
ncbi:hypothetical protein SODALDRAFT_285960 [Sodiomyces alkalinus F11]|uniref:Alpha-ketoglutarate-dependent dioxygenase AlkB-like domain-containing protein n=1 Tax=Sodiomyces alkalinus (strain CBS 110278 / VKM F-3762 / F11) TaxID=1314773 RepID=A0A3N2PJV6_SODAK|nr:hypothetical protein SODALDRAFT_285960 [Sodiomyces alkalinus F11]ROT34664.1 hypothetical protein SODALDRAFT_285960 [Sodiomyces alkalinus F11]